jgi:hypothetical protein
LEWRDAAFLRAAVREQNWASIFQSSAWTIGAGWPISKLRRAFQRFFARMEIPTPTGNGRISMPRCRAEVQAEEVGTGRFEPEL